MDHTGRGQLIDSLQSLLELRNLLEHAIATCVDAIDRSGIARRQGLSTRELLCRMGVAPAVASRWLRVSGGLGELSALSEHAAEGRFSPEHVDAVVRGINHLRTRSPDGLTAEDRSEHEQALVAQVFSGAAPAEVVEAARRRANTSPQPQSPAAADDRRINTLDYTRTDDGRLHIRADVTADIGEKLITAVEHLAAPRPEPDGSPDTRSAGRRRADALELLLEHATGMPSATVLAFPGVDQAGDRSMATPGGPGSHVVVTVPADTPDLAELTWMGPITAGAAELMTCDARTTHMFVDTESVPLSMGRTRRLFPQHLRRALTVRDEGCVKCGAPPSWTHAHHIVHWSQGGPTDLDNGCLLCPSCHDDIHHGGWDVHIGYDGHPWLTPPAAHDPRRTPQPAHNRRTLRIDAVA